MPYLVVTGRGSWNHAGKSFGPGVHEVDREAADAAVESRISSLFVSELEPEIMRTPDTLSPLSLEDIRIGTDHGVRLRVDEPVVENVDSSGRIFEFPCPYCDKRLGSSGARDRHVEMNHELLPA
jgi:hypothetical protein